MKKKLIIILTLFCINTFSQNNNSNLNDSLMYKITSYINEYKWVFWISDEINTKTMTKLQIEANEKIVFSGDSLLFITKEGRKRISLIDTITSVDDAETPSIRVGSKLLITLPYRSNGKYKAGRFYFNEESKKRITLLYNLMLPLSDKFRKDEDMKINNEPELFKKIVEQYKSLENQTISEEQRKFIVQANQLAEDKKYYDAYSYYEKVLKINPVSYPYAYYNMAILKENIKDFKRAIMNMKKYLILLPNTEDARKAQDKIYEWELFVKK
ncbi:tetratricopeptide repeat protein [Flavobacterium lacisediminis]|uniref:Tetratricopeptide repeat protein n=1 Tax=Flavobacterium lacisediminis TaxID=2989705 RepID=A0ABT3EMB5_9FLAO|nr:hypothetical protein [Flavobacterium lacisediminis]MCW1149225.1 hypothetical protein [Flavobacterium lacisediminis]